MKEAPRPLSASFTEGAKNDTTFSESIPSISSMDTFTPNNAVFTEAEGEPKVQREINPSDFTSSIIWSNWNHPVSSRNVVWDQEFDNLFLVWDNTPSYIKVSPESITNVMEESLSSPSSPAIAIDLSGTNRECRDIDGNVYSTVQIGDQLWMAENLKTTKYKDGSEIPTGHPNWVWRNLETDAYAVYDGDSSNADVYGNLYNWYAVDDSKGLAPNGWHIPTDEEIKVLERSVGMSQNHSDYDGIYRGTNEGSKLAGMADLWVYWDGGIVDNSEFGTSGFNVIPSGKRDHGNGSYGNLGTHCRLWSSTEGADIGDNEAAYIRIFSRIFPKISRQHMQKGNAYSVRCVWNGAPKYGFVSSIQTEYTEV